MYTRTQPSGDNIRRTNHHLPQKLSVCSRDPGVFCQARYRSQGEDAGQDIQVIRSVPMGPFLVHIEGRIAVTPSTPEMIGQTASASSLGRRDCRVITREIGHLDPQYALPEKILANNTIIVRAERTKVPTSCIVPDNPIDDEGYETCYRSIPLLPCSVHIRIFEAESHQTRAKQTVLPSTRKHTRAYTKLSLFPAIDFGTTR